MDMKSQDRWEVRMGLGHVMVVLGICTGLMTCIFFVGYFAGRQVGYEAAFSASVANTAKFPIAQQDLEEERGDSTASEVYAKLNESRTGDLAGSEKKEPVPDLASIPSTDAVPLNDGSPAEPVAGAPEEEVRPEERSIAGIAPGDDPAEKSATLGESLDAAGGIEKTEPVKNAEEPSQKDLESLLAERAKNERAAAIKREQEQQREQEKVKEKEAAKAAALKAKEKEKAKEPVKAKPAEGAPTGGWFAQVAAPKKRDDAQAISSKLRQSGFAVMIEVAQVRGEQYYRVLVGPEASKAQAEKLVTQLKRERSIQSEPFIRMVK